MKARSNPAPQRTTATASAAFAGRDGTATYAQVILGDSNDCADSTQLVEINALPALMARIHASLSLAGENSRPG
ncbi:MAG: hypothetical protein ABIQ70_07255 [Dokdonella sp.]